MITLPFQRKKKEKFRPPLIEKDKAVERLKKVKQEEAKIKTQKKTSKKETGRSSVAPFVLKEPIISEKGTILEEKGKYLFKTFPEANKNNMKRAIEELYRVKVKKINIIKVPAKKIRMGRTEGEKKGYKKAIITLEKGQKLEVVSK